MAGIDLQNSEWCDMVFRDRNQEYGAYQLRKEYNRRVIRAIIIGLIGVALIAAVPIIISVIKANLPHNNVVVDMKTKLANIKINQPKKLPPPPPVPPPPPAIKSVKFTAPKIVKQDSVKQKDIPPPQETIKKDVLVGDKTQNGLSKFDVPIGTPNGTGKVVGGVVDNKVYSYASIQQRPKFPGDIAKYIQNHLTYPEAAKEAGVQGRVIVKFTIEKDGSISGIQVLLGQNLGFGLAKEAEKVVKGMPKWTPGQQNGHAVRVSFIQPFIFSLN